VSGKYLTNHAVASKLEPTSATPPSSEGVIDFLPVFIVLSAPIIDAERNEPVEFYGIFNRHYPVVLLVQHDGWRKPRKLAPDRLRQKAEKVL